jgi:hypothetical protein
VRFLTRFVALLELFAIVCTGCTPPDAAKERPPKESPPKQGAAIDPTESSKEPPGDTVLKLSSREFYEDFTKDSRAAQAKYNGKRIEITGLVKSHKAFITGQNIFLLEGDPENLYFGVECIPRDDGYPAMLAAPGQTVTVKGRTRFEFATHILFDVEIVKVEGPKPPVFTTDSLAAEFAKDHDAAMSKYKNKWAAVSGEIETAEASHLNEATLVLKTLSKGPRVVAHFPAHTTRKTAFKIGQKIEFIGLLDDMTVSAKEIGLLLCQLTTARK